MSHPLIQKRDALLEEARALAETDLADEDLARFEEIETELEDVNKRIRVLDAYTRGGASESGEDRSGAPQLMRRTPTEVRDIRTAGRLEVRDAANALLEQEHRSQQVMVTDETATEVANLFGRRSVAEDGTILFDGDGLARRFLATETADYRSAFQKGLRYTQPAWSPEESAALNMYRAAEQSLTSASGGYGVPVLIDPTVILTSGAGVAPLLDVSRIERITNNIWKGVSSAGVAFTTHAEGAAVTATQATLAQPTITPETTACFIPFSVEIEGDYPGFANEMSRLIEQAYVDFLAAETATGTAGVVGIFTAIDQTAGSEVAVTTDGQLGPADAIKVFKALPERYRPRSSWFMNISVETQMRNASALGGLYTTDLSTEGIGPLLGKRVLLSDYAPSFSGTTGASNLSVVGSFDRYVVAQRVGMSIELVPHVVDGSGLPTLQRGYLAWARVGADSVDDNGFRLLQNQ